MPTLLHIDSSAITDGSVSREVTAAFRAAWEAEHPAPVLPDPVPTDTDVLNTLLGVCADG